jgi:flagellar biosynthesis protein FlhG
MIRVEDQAQGLRVRFEGEERARRTRGGATWTVAVTSGKGGVGKTQVSANLAVGLAQQGLRVLLLDADLGLASLDLALGARPRADLVEVVRGQATLGDVLVPVAHGLDLVPACPGRYEMANLDASSRDRLSDLVRELAESYDVLLIDTGAGIGASTIAFAAEADEVILVATPDPSSLRDAYAMAKVLQVRADVRRLHLVANFVGSSREGLALRDRLQSIVDRFFVLDLDLAASIPVDPEVVEANRAGHPVILGSPESSGARALQSLSHRIGALFRKEATC